MNSLFDVQTSQEITQRIENLKVDSPRQWGKMDVAQMLAHCAFSMETAIGDKNPSRRAFSDPQFERFDGGFEWRRWT